MRLMNHSPRLKTDAPNHDDMKIPTTNMNVTEVTNPRPKKSNWKNMILVLWLLLFTGCLEVCFESGYVI